MVGGVQYEHTHRMIAEFIGLLIIVMAVWTQRVETRKWMRVLGWTALAAVVGQGILGGLTVLNLLPWSISTAHATLGQTIFCIVLRWRCSPAAVGCRTNILIPERDLAPSTPTLASIGGSLRMGTVDPGRGLPSLRHQTSAAPGRRVRGHRAGLLDHRSRADALRQCSLTCASRHNCCWRC